MLFIQQHVIGPRNTTNIHSNLAVTAVVSSKHCENEDFVKITEILIISLYSMYVVGTTCIVPTR